MCLLFLSLDDAPGEDRFSVIIVNNRDEVWDRPTKLADFWPSKPDCISGLDQTPGKEGGTWFGFSKRGKFASVLNILSSENEAGKKGRGFLVQDYITGEDDRDFHENLIKEADRYNGFNFVTLSIRPGFKFTLTFLSNWKQFYSGPINIPPKGIHGFGNCRHDKSWRKVEAGKSKFAQIVTENGFIKQKDVLVDSIFNFLTDKTKYLPDEALESQGKHLPEDLRTERAALNVWSPKYRYGTRTISMILISPDGNVDYIEKTLKEPVSVTDPEWITTTHRFQMDV